MTAPYQPIACALYDAFEAAATHARVVRLEVTGEDGVRRTVDTRIRDLFTQDGVEYARLDDGTAVRLDRLAIVDGSRFD